jgi:glucose/arabinose dehydrogenase
MSSVYRFTTLLVAGLIGFVTLPFTGCGNGDSSNTGTTKGGGPPPPTSLKLETVRTGFSALTFLTAPPNDTARLFVVEQVGRIQILNRATGVPKPVPFFNVVGQISTSGEEGLLGLAFDPNYNTNRQFYVFYTDQSGNPTVARYLENAMNPDLADQSTGVALVSVAHPNATNHNGGMLAFGPDGCLYASIGDGGTGGAPAQNTGSLLGKILRLNPDAPGPPAACTNSGPNPFGNEIWSYGLRNPFRFSFDRGTNDLYIADDGENTREEVDIATGAQAGKGLNYGWKIMEGFLCVVPGCNQAGLTLPTFDYPHGSGVFCDGAIIGGFVYRGLAIPAEQGNYFYADFCLQFVKTFNKQSMQTTDLPALQPAGENITSFGEDAQGELYVLTNQGGVYRIIPN